MQGLVGLLVWSVVVTADELVESCLRRCGRGAMCLPGLETESCGCELASPGLYQRESDGGCRRLYNHCLSAPCHHTARCVSTFGGYFCRCPPGRFGKDCRSLATGVENVYQFVQGIYAFYKILPETNSTREMFISIPRPGTDFKMVVKITDDYRETEFSFLDLKNFNARRYCMADRTDKNVCMLIKAGELPTVRVVVSKSTRVEGGWRDVWLGQSAGRLKEVTLELYNGGLCSYRHSYNVLVDIQPASMTCLPKTRLHGCSLERRNPTKINECKPPIISLISITKDCGLLETRKEILFKDDNRVIQKTMISSEYITMPDSLNIEKPYELQAFYYKIGNSSEFMYEEFLLDKTQCWFKIEKCKSENKGRNYQLQHLSSRQSILEKRSIFLNHRRKDEGLSDALWRFMGGWDDEEDSPRKRRKKKPTTKQPTPSTAKTTTSTTTETTTTALSPATLLEDLLEFLKTHPDDSRNLQTTKNLIVSLEETVYRVLEYLGGHTLDKKELRETSGTMFKVIDILIKSQLANPINRSETDIPSRELHFKMQEQDGTFPEENFVERVGSCKRCNTVDVSFPVKTSIHFSVQLKETGRLHFQEERRSLNIMNHISTLSVRLLRSIEPFEKLNFSTSHFETFVTMNTFANLSKKPIGDDEASVLVIHKSENPHKLMKLVVTKYKENLLQWSDMDPDSPLVQIYTFKGDKKLENIPVEVSMKVKPQKTEYSGIIEDSDHVKIHKFILNDNEPSWGLLNFNFKNNTPVLKVKCMLNEIPDLNSIKYSGESINKSYTEFQFDASGGHYDTIVYLGISSEEISTPQKYSFEMTNGQCLIWGEGNWLDGNCKVKFDSNKGRLSCACNHTSLFSSALFTPPHIINPIIDIYLFRTFLHNPFVGMVVMVFLVALVVLLIWGRYKDMRRLKNTAELLFDSPMGNYPYLIGVYTGTTIGAGTTADVCIQIFGSESQSLVHNLKSREVKALQVGQDDWFLIYSDKKLGKITSIKLFHNDMGSSPDWYCTKLVIYDITNRETYLFEISDWISILYLNNNGSIEKVFFPVDLNVYKQDNVRGNLSIGLRTNHSWLCIFTTHQRSPFTRCQLIMSSCTMLFFSMLLSMMFYGALEGKPEDFPAIGLKIADYLIALETFLIALPVTMILKFFFLRPAKLRMKREAESVEEIKKKNEVNIENEPVLKKWARKHFTQEFKAFPLLPVTMADRTMTTKKEQIWLAVAWTLAAVTILTCAFFIVWYSLKFGRYKSTQWLLTFFLGWSQDIALIQPFNVVLTSILLAVIFRREASVDRFYFKLVDLKESQLRISEAINLRIHNSVYTPITSDEVKIRLLMREKKEFYKWIILRLGITLILLLLTVDIVVHRNVEKKQIEIQYFREIADGLGEMERMYNQKGLIDFLRIVMPPFCSMSYHPEEVKTEGICTKYSPRIVGLPLIRQQRVKPNKGILSDYFKDIYTSADVPLSQFTQDTKSYMFGWYSDDKKGLKSRDRWNYSNYLALQTTSMYGYTLMSYDGGGYTQELGFSQETSRDKFFKLNRYKFIDTYTRAVFLEYNVYDPNTNTFVIVRLLAENFADGIYTVSLEIEGDSFGRRGGRIEFSFIVVWSLFVALFLGLCIQTICDITIIGLWRSLSNPQTIVDFTCILFGAMILYYSVTKVLFYKFYMEGQLKQYGEHFISFTYPMYEAFMFKDVLGFFIVSLALRIVFILSDRITAIYFRGMLFLRPYTLFALFFVIAYFNSFFNVIIQYFGCPGFPGLITIVYDKITMAYYLENTAIHTEYIIIVLYNYVFYFTRILFIAAAICYYRDSVDFLNEYLERNELKPGKYFGQFKKFFNRKKVIEFKEKKINSPKERIKYSDFESHGAQTQRAREVDKIFKDINASIESRQNKLKKMLVNMNIILKHIDETQGK